MTEQKIHRIELIRKGKNALLPVPLPELLVGDTVEYFFKEKGEVVVEFPQLSPFSERTVTNAKALVVKNSGKFICRCRVILPDGEVIGWNDADPEGTRLSGGEHNVRKPV